MPHVIVQATPNVTIECTKTLLQQLNSTLWDTGNFDTVQAIKSRMLQLDTFLVGIEDDKQSEGFVYVQLRLMPGRTQQVRDELADKLLVCLQDELIKQQSDYVTVQYCVEVVELSDAYRKVTV